MDMPISKILILVEFFYLLPSIGIGYWLFGKDEKLSGGAKVALTLYFSLVTIPWVATSLALDFGLLIRLGILMHLVMIVTLIFIYPLWKWFRNLKLGLPKTNDVLMIVVGACAATVYALIHTRSELLFQLYSWIVRDDAYCFYLVIFKAMAAPGLPIQEHLKEVAAIITTPGNVPYPATAIVLFKKFGMQAMHAAFAAVLAVFAYLSAQRLLKNPLYGLLAAAAVILNPYLLSVPVLDRNLIALATSSVIFYLLIAGAGRPIALGLLLGLVSGMGLRFLPSLMVIPVLLALYWRGQLKPKPLIFLALGFLITFSTVSYTHLRAHET